MNEKERIEYLKTNHFHDWSSARQKVFDELSDKQSMFCCCGKLATGLHEASCSKFNRMVDCETASRLKGLENDIKEIQEAAFMPSVSTRRYHTSDNL